MSRWLFFVLFCFKIAFEENKDFFVYKCLVLSIATFPGFPGAFSSIPVTHSQKHPPSLLSPHLSSRLGHFWKKEKKEALASCLLAFNLHWVADAAGFFSFLLLQLSKLSLTLLLKPPIPPLNNNPHHFHPDHVYLAKIQPLLWSNCFRCPVPVSPRGLFPSQSTSFLCLLLCLQALVPISICKRVCFTHWNRKQNYRQWACVPSWWLFTYLASPGNTSLSHLPLQLSKSVCSLPPSSPF